MNSIKEIKKKKTLGIINNTIEIKIFEEKTKTLNTYSFTSFANRNIAYRRLSMVWKACLRLNHNRESITQKSENGSSSNDEEEFNLGFNRSENISLSATSVENVMDNNKEDVFFPPIDADKNIEYAKLQFKMTTQAFYDKILRDGAEFGFDKYFETFCGSTNFTMTEWKELGEVQEELVNSSQIPNNQSSNPNIQVSSQNVNQLVSSQLILKDGVTYVRDVKFVIKIKNVPFVNQTRVHKAQKLKKDGDKFILSCCNITLDTPYCSYYQIEDQWEIVPYDGDKCVVRYLFI